MKRSYNDDEVVYVKSLVLLITLALMVSLGLVASPMTATVEASDVKDAH